MKLRELLTGSGFTGAQAVAYLKFTKVFKPPFSVALHQDEIANRVNLTKPELSKLFNGFVGKGWLSSRRDVERIRGGRIYESTVQFNEYWGSLKWPESEVPLCSVAEELVGLRCDTGHYSRALKSWGRDVRSRLLAALVIEAADSSGLTCNLTRADLVALTGMTYEGVKKSLNSMQKERLLHYVSPANPINFPFKDSEKLFEKARRRLAQDENDSSEVELGEVVGWRGFGASPLMIYLNLDWLGLENPLGRFFLVDFISTNILNRILMFGALPREAPAELSHLSNVYLKQELADLDLKLDDDIKNWLWVAFRDTKRARTRILRGVIGSVDFMLGRIMRIGGAERGIGFERLASKSLRSTIPDVSSAFKFGTVGVEETIAYSLARLELRNLLETLGGYCNEKLADRVVTNISCFPVEGLPLELTVFVQLREKI